MAAPSPTLSWGRHAPLSPSSSLASSPSAPSRPCSQLLSSDIAAVCDYEDHLTSDEMDAMDEIDQLDADDLDGMDGADGADGADGVDSVDAAGAGAAVDRDPERALSPAAATAAPDLALNAAYAYSSTYEPPHALDDAFALDGALALGGTWALRLAEDLDSQEERAMVIAAKEQAMWVVARATAAATAATTAAAAVAANAAAGAAAGVGAPPPRTHFAASQRPLPRPLSLSPLMSPRPPLSACPTTLPRRHRAKACGPRRCSSSSTGSDASPAPCPGTPDAAAVAASAAALHPSPAPSGAPSPKPGAAGTAVPASPALSTASYTARASGLRRRRALPAALLLPNATSPATGAPMITTTLPRRRPVAASAMAFEDAPVSAAAVLPAASAMQAPASPAPSHASTVSVGSAAATTPCRPAPALPLLALLPQSTPIPELAAIGSPDAVSCGDSDSDATLDDDGDGDGAADLDDAAARARAADDEQPLSLRLPCLMRRQNLRKLQTHLFGPDGRGEAPRASAAADFGVPMRRPHDSDAYAYDSITYTQAAPLSCPTGLHRGSPADLDLRFVNESVLLAQAREQARAVFGSLSGSRLAAPMA
ncbi:hypothetical protein CXG81DRAFT_23451 [Caulochytrium protostelioides]|uniref:Uncharacterized protein n=1 Tax=Caulochytrium protostelioides TaxID=1555241 RepID=A0A4P9XEC8_9FUNG|nr:hypothetical protein CXG81DRAFT_23451 [Caulochytrium protostelioides]|eukprot:RKP03895.1 hypothetical protein CXG81DRAFT_23451 [Caulochytrium protostelioides]